MTQPAPPSDHPFWKVWEQLTTANTWLYRRTGGRVGGKMPGYDAPIILVHHVGRKSGVHRVSPMVGLADAGRWLVVASKGGTDRHPAWLHNLQAHPETEIEVGRDRIPVTATVLGEEARAQVWPELVEIYPPFDEYREFAGERQIQVISLEPRQAERLK